MRTNIEIDDELLKEALRTTGLKTKRAVVEEGLRKLIRLKAQEDILNLPKNIHWEGDLNESRLGPGPRNPRRTEGKGPPRRTRPAGGSKPPGPSGPRR